MEYRRSSHCLYHCEYHLVITTKYRRKIINEGLWAFLKEVYWGTDGIWSDGYFVSTTGVTPNIIERYIEKQGREDAGQTAKLFE